MAVAVSDAERSARRWKESVGFVVRTLPGSGHGVLVASPGDRFILHPCDGIEAVDPGNSGIAFITDGIEEGVSRMAKTGVTVVEPLRRGSGRASAKFEHPDGKTFWLFGVPTDFVRRTMRSRAPAPSGCRSRSPARKRSSRRRTRSQADRATKTARLAPKRDCIHSRFWRWRDVPKPSQRPTAAVGGPSAAGNPDRSATTRHEERGGEATVALAPPSRDPQ
jgi:hypothetical protein